MVRRAEGRGRGAGEGRGREREEGGGRGKRVQRWLHLAVCCCFAAAVQRKLKKLHSSSKLELFQDPSPPPLHPVLKLKRKKTITHYYIGTWTGYTDRI